jgi:hypothetical protein
MTMPDPDWTLTEDRFRFLFGPLAADGDAAWSLYEAAQLEHDEATDMFGEPDLADEDTEDEFFAMRLWVDALDRLITDATDDEAAAFLDRLLAAFIEDLHETFAFLDMVVTRIPDCGPAIDDARRQVAARVTAMLAT